LPVVDATTRDQDVAAIGLLHEPARRRLYDWVSAQTQPVGREAAAAAVGINRALAAFHLDRLVEAGLLRAGYRRLTGRTGPGAGRPARVYSRSGRTVSVSVPDRRYERAANLFASALEAAGASAPTDGLVDGARKFGAKLGEAGDGEPGSVGKLLNVLRHNGYQPVFDGSDTIRLLNCPFDALVAEHRPLVCGTNLALAQGFAAGTTTSGYQPMIDQQPGYCCVAFVREPGPPHPI
jgi:predicted ArsR family transcriptional regulator